ncbi:BatD family protein [Flavobacterium sp. I3-2]|uniref:BatD family protein n=1 Tax=Flavobacterium sp. I3-2 TaxID=2748319 RepID=UPI0015AAEBE6|nr:BatD family protein [Flavobacterium sp. I3-2]
MKFITNISCALVLLFSSLAWSQFTFVSEVSRNSIGINERIEVRFSMNQDGDNFNPPNFENFKVVGGPMHSVSQVWVNGKASFTKSFSYYLVPEKKGILQIGTATIEYRGTVYKSNVVTVKVGDAVQQQQRQQQNYGYGGYYGRQPQSQPQIDRSKMGEGIFLDREISNTNPYVNEPITVVYRLYVSHNAGVRNIGQAELPKYKNFWSHTIDEKEMRVQVGQYKGKEYRYIVLQKVVLLPLKDGTLDLEPFELNLQIESMTGRYDIFGAPEIVLNEKQYSTGSKKINVKPLPLENQPIDFTGAVGKFDFKVTPNKTTVKANETIELNVSVNGSGNLDLLNLPKPVAPAVLEIYDPQLIEKINKNIKTGMDGSKTEKYTIVPQYKGKYVIKPMSFSYFDVASKTYKTITSEEIVIDVTEGPELPTNLPEKDELSNSDVFVDIVKEVNFDTEEKSNFFDTNLFYFLLIAPIVAMPLVVLVDRQRKKAAGDIVGNRLRTNNRLAKKYLGEAKRNLGNKDKFYEALERCLHNFLKAKLHIETSEMSNDIIVETLRNKNISEESIQAFMHLKETCEMARYSQMSVETMNNDYAQAADVISSLEKQFKTLK